jgi:saccharopine dehydrogenase-like NADP-dependent oxidoreductase
MRIAVLGAGMVGRAMALDLAKSFKVSSFDVSEQNLTILKERNSAIETKRVDLGDYSQYSSLLSPFDLVITAVPGFMGYNCLKECCGYFIFP